MIYETYNEKSSLFPNQTVQGRANELYRKEDVPVLPRRYHEKLREGDKTINKKHLYPEEKFPHLYNKKEPENTDAGNATPVKTAEDDSDGET